MTKYGVAPEELTKEAQDADAVKQKKPPEKRHNEKDPKPSS